MRTSCLIRDGGNLSRSCNPQPLTHKPQIPNSEPQTPNSKPQTPTPKLQTPNPQSSADQIRGGGGPAQKPSATDRRPRRKGAEQGRRASRKVTRPVSPS